MLLVVASFELRQDVIDNYIFRGLAE